MGHTDANYEETRAAIARGVRHAVHVYNAMRPFTHRDPGVIGAVLTSPEVTAELIADGVHVEDGAMRLLLRSEEHTSELQSRPHLVCRLLLEKKKTIACDIRLNTCNWHTSDRAA